MKTTVWPDRSDQNWTLLHSERPTDNPIYPCDLFCDAYLVRTGDGHTGDRYSVTVVTGAAEENYWSAPLGTAVRHALQGTSFSNPAYDRAVFASLAFLALGLLRPF